MKFNLPNALTWFRVVAIPLVVAVFFGTELFGWQETGFRTSVAVAVITEVVATVALTLALAVAAGQTNGRSALNH